MLAEEKLKAGDLPGAKAALQDAVRKDPSNAKLRIFLFQLLAVLGEWERAVAQLKVSAELAAEAEPMARAYREAIICEVFRAKVFAGEKDPLLFGEPAEWMALLVEAAKNIIAGQPAAATPLRDKAFETAPTVSGDIDGQRFEWIADADMRFGPLLEIVINGRYFWAPFTAFESIQFDEPKDLRDNVWTAAQVKSASGGEVVAFIPTRYPGAEADEGNAIRLARSTDWVDVGADTWIGRGQRMFATDAGEIPIMDARRITFDTPPADMDAGEAEGDDG